MIAGKIEFVKSHECIENKTNTVAIEQYCGTDLYKNN